MKKRRNCHSNGSHSCHRYRFPIYFCLQLKSFKTPK
jgi:hypothetical protein